MFKLIIATLVFSITLLANNNFDAIKKESPSTAKDLFLWQISKYEDLNNTELWQAFLMSKAPKKAHLDILIQKNQDINLTVANQTPQQIMINLNLSNQASEDNITRLAILSPKKAQILSLIHNTNALQSIDTQTYIDLILNTSQAWRKENFSFPPNKDICENKNIDKIVKRAIFADNQVILDIFQNCNIKSSQALFYIGINLYLHKSQFATQYFTKSAQFATQSQDKEKALYFAYKTSGKKEFLEKSAKSGDGFYATLSKLELDQTLQMPIFINEYTQTDTANIDINISSPFEQHLTTRYFKSLNKHELNVFQNNIKQSGYEQLWAKIEEFKTGNKDIFLLPYNTEFKQETPIDKALWLSIARQESRFFPNDISSAYAIGVMQIIPDLAYDLNKSIKPLELLNPKINIPLAIKHFKNLKNKYSSIGYIAIAYNAGPGYLKRLSEANHFTKHEPLVALELIDYDETREYVKFVTINFIKYSQILDIKIDKKAILQNPFEQVHNLH